jgi:hypothetical protein
MQCSAIGTVAQEVTALALGRQHRKKLKDLLNKKELVEFLQNQLRLARKHKKDPQNRLTPLNRHNAVLTQGSEPAIYNASLSDIEVSMATLSLIVEQLDDVIGMNLVTQGL